jgi:hypothetical protein
MLQESHQKVEATDPSVRKPQRDDCFWQKSCWVSQWASIGLQLSEEKAIDVTRREWQIGSMVLLLLSGESLIFAVYGTPNLRAKVDS